MLLLLAACGTTEVTVAGTIFTDHFATAPLPGVDVTVLTSSFQPWSDATTEADGTFMAAAPPSAPIYLEIRGDGTLPIVFGGSSGSQDLFVVPDGQLFGFPPGEEAEWRATFAGCPGAADGDGMIVGEVRIAVPGADPLDSDLPIDSQGFAFVESEDGTRVDACYLNDDGLAWSAEATTTGTTGRFAIFGVAGGPWRLGVGRRLPGSSIVFDQTVWVPEGGVVSLQPALVEL